MLELQALLVINAVTLVEEDEMKFASHGSYR